MTDTIIVAIISMLGTMAGAYFANRKSTALIDYRLKNLENEVVKNNSAIERIYALEERMAIEEEKIKVANHRIDDLERGGGA